MEDSIKYNHTETTHNTSAANIILPIVFQFMQPQSIIDIGCGTGTWLYAATQLGIEDVLGVDGYNVDKSKLLIPDDRFLSHDLRTDFKLNKKFDLAICLEVGEHLDEKNSDVLIKTIVEHADTVLFSAAIPFQGGQNHCNEQPIDYWEKKFHHYGYKFYDVIRPFVWENKNVDWWYAQNSFIVSKLDFTDKIKNIHIPTIKNVVHPELYNYRIANILHIKESLHLRESIYDGYLLIRPSRKHLLKLILGLK
jgi:SAM-dependent methyltransferase